MIDDENECSDLYEELYAEVEVQANSAINFNKSVDDDLESDSDEEGLNIILNNNPANVDPVAVSNSEEDFDAVQQHPFAYELKPWRQPGVDMTDYFNFGFDEDKWKRYCIDLQKGRAMHTRKISTGEQIQFGYAINSVNGEPNVIQNIGPNMRIASKNLNAENISIPKHPEYHPEYQQFNTDHNRSRFVDEGEYSSERYLSNVKDNGRHGRRKRREEDSKWGNGFAHENRRRCDFKGEKFKRYIPNKGRIRNRENWENYDRPKFKYPRRRYNSPPRHFHNCVSTEKQSWSSRYTSKRMLHCTSSARCNVYDKHVRHGRFRHQMQNRARFNGENRYEETDVVQCRCKQTREEDNRSNRFNRSCHVFRRGNCEQVPRRRCDDLADDVPKEKSTRQGSEGGRKHEKTESKKSTNSSSERQMEKQPEEEKPKIEENEKREEQGINNIDITQENEAMLEIEEGQIIPQDASESSIDDYISSWFRDPVSGDDQSGFGSSDLWML